MREIVIVTAFVGVFALFAIEATAVTEKAPTTIKKERPYPGGRDEEEIKVQETLAPPSSKVDRHSIEAQILKKYFNKIEQETKSNAKPESEAEAQ